MEISSLDRSWIIYPKRFVFRFLIVQIMEKQKNNKLIKTQRTLNFEFFVGNVFMCNFYHGSLVFFFKIFKAYCQVVLGPRCTTSNKMKQSYHKFGFLALPEKCNLHYDIENKFKIQKWKFEFNIKHLVKPKYNCIFWDV